ncbi:sigma-70 family RNA polymerase sigma factor [Nonomuraea soli]|uniref:RNA polymerase sigma factor (Sigma-70 family) n=1 Tax=Nonomuraea soli TaxID=1032476 RepID=A0A7W0CF68_9ACTN|nr:sigma-70 family RNA polymerase sigma factor [Nonomuraea soli]MBA2890029.1 RNA polymerase sigma factor (sigma-70 family) [Nonomuraea soli]
MNTPLLNAEEEVALARRIEAGLYAEHLLETRGHDPDLEAVAADGRAARERMICANLRLVMSVAKRYAHRGLPFADVVQDGNVGLIQAVEHYDHTRGTRFSTCATWWIRKAILQGLERARTIRIPPHPVRAPWACVTLDMTLGEVLADPDVKSTEQIVENHLLHDSLLPAVDTLAPRQALIMRMRFGLDGHAPRTRRQVATELGLTPTWVRSLEQESLAWLRRRPEVYQLAG